VARTRRAAEELLQEVEARGVTVVADGGDLRIRPASRLTPELVEGLRARKAELVERLSWPEECLAAERECGHPCGRLFPLVGRLVRTPAGCGRLVAALPERAVVVVGGRYEAFILGEVRPAG
jgi:hypothetical protein